MEVDPKPEGASQRMAEVVVRVTPPVGGAGPGAESGSRASGLVGTLRGRRHIPVASFLLCPFSGLESVFPEPCQKEWI